jgi:4-hydroxy 2-oxovalerate aldolase
MDIMHLDCTLRDGGYYNNWDFSFDLINDYLNAVNAVGVDVVELGFRSLKNSGFKGACAYTTDAFLKSLSIPKGLMVGVMVNASELVDGEHLEIILQKLFPVAANLSPVKLVRIAAHIHEFSQALSAIDWLKQRGYKVGINLMQIADRTKEEIINIATKAAVYTLDVLYFADSMGSMNPKETAKVASWLREGTHGEIGIHTHDNMGMALQNTLKAIEQGVTWVDSTITGMGRGPGNARTEELAIEIAAQRVKKIHLIPLMTLLRKHFKPMQLQYGWGTNPYYYLAGKYGIHPSFIQEMINDTRYNDEDIIAVIEHLRIEGGKKFTLNNLDGARNFYQGDTVGNWRPAEMMSGREVLLLGTGPGVANHRQAIEQYIRAHKPLVVALNTQSKIAQELIDLRIACHPVRLLADCEEHTHLPQPLIAPVSILPKDIQNSLQSKELYDFGLNIELGCFAFNETHCTIPNSMVVAYTLAMVTSGKANRILMAGFDGYSADDPRSKEMQALLDIYLLTKDALELIAVTPTRYNLSVISVYLLCGGSF